MEKKGPFEHNGNHPECACGHEENMGVVKSDESGQQEKKANEKKKKNVINNSVTNGVCSMWNKDTTRKTTPFHMGREGFHLLKKILVGTCSSWRLSAAANMAVPARLDTPAANRRMGEADIVVSSFRAEGGKHGT